MSKSPQDVYARHLLSSRGYPLWIPEPSHHLLLSRPDGLRIGDVGVVVPEDGGFDVFFNVCLPREHPFHRATGVPDHFNLVELRDEDIRIIPRVENPGRIISSSSVTKIRTFGPPGDTPSAQSGGLGYEFDLSSSGGALLILPEGADRYDLQNRRLFFEEATRHGVDWYRFAEEQLGRMISHDSLYLITGFYKTRSWSLAAFENTTGSGEFSAQFKMAQFGGSNNAGTYTWETTRALDWRVGPAENYEFPNQSVFIRGFKIALRTDILGQKRIDVKADAPSTGFKHGKLSHDVKRDSWISNVWKGLSRDGRPGMSMQDEVVTGPITDRASDDLTRGVQDDAGVHVVIQPMPELSEIFHPSDVVNRYLFEKEASASVAVTHDDDWITLLDKGQLKPEDFVLQNFSRVEETVTNNFNVISQEGVVFLQGKNGAAANDVSICTITEGHESIREHQVPVVSEAQSKEWIPEVPAIRHNDVSFPEAQAVRYNPPAVSPLHETTLQDIVTAGTVDQLPGSSWIRTQGSKDMRDEIFNSPVDVEVPPPAYGEERMEHHESADVTKKSPLVLELLGVPVVTQETDIHWLLLPYHPRTSKHLLRFDVMFPEDRICYQYSNNIRQSLTDEELDEPAFSEPTTKMRITFEQRPFSWTIDVDNPHRIRCRDVFKAIYDSFDQQLTLGELWCVPDRSACEEAFRIRTLVLASSEKERLLGWKRVDTLLYHTVFHGLTMNSEGEWVLNLGAPLPVTYLPPSSMQLSRCNSSSTEEENNESSDEDRSLFPRGLDPTKPEHAKRPALHPLPSYSIFPAVPPRQQFRQARPTHRPLGPRPPPKLMAMN